MKKYNSTSTRIFSHTNSQKPKPKNDMPAHQELVELHNSDPYWKEKLEHSHQFETYMKKLQKIVSRLQETYGIHVSIFFDTKKYYKHFKFVCKLTMNGSGIAFTTEKMSEHYLQPVIDAIHQSIAYLQHQESVSRDIHQAA